MKLRSVGVVSLIFFLCIGLAAPASAQDLETLLERYTGDNANGYIKPLVTAFGANLNSGVYRNAKVPKDGLHINIAVNAMLSFFSDDQKTFIAKTQGNFYPAAEVETATVVGKEGGVVEGTGGTQFRFPDGYDLKSMPMAVPTVTIGSVAGTEASLRFFKYSAGEDIGDISLFGIGARHSISQYIPLSQVDLAAGVFFHTFKVGDIIDSKTFIAHAEVGKSFLLFDLYGGLGFETNKASVDYTFDIDGQSNDVSIDVTGENKFRATVGVGFNLLVLHINVDYNIGNQNLLNAGVSVGL